MAHDVFISYAVEDKPTADAICATLEAKQIRCWIAPRDVLPGEDYAEALIGAIYESRLLILVFSANTNQSSHVLRELERAASKGIPILPLRIEDVPLSPSLEYFISRTHWLDALTPPLERHLQHLAETVGMLLARIGRPAPAAGPAEAPVSPPGAEVEPDKELTRPPPSRGAFEVAKRWAGRPLVRLALGIGAIATMIIIVLVALLSGGGGDGGEGQAVEVVDRSTVTATPTPTVEPTGSPLEGMMFYNVIFSSGVTDDDEPVEVVDAFSSGATEVCAFWDYEGMTDGLTLDVEWFIDGEFTESGSRIDETWEGGQSGNWWHCTASDSGLPDGLYEVVLSVEGEALVGDAVFVGGDHPLVELSVENLLQESACYVYASPSGAKKWGQDEMGLDERILPGDTATFPIPAGVYDLLVKNCDNETLADEFDLDISGATAYQVR